MGTGVPSISFLSRLCGGEDMGSNPVAFRCFLSRLCGGEGAVVDAEFSTVFLSRLCGGEVYKTNSGGLMLVSKPPMWR